MLFCVIDTAAECFQGKGRSDKVLPSSGVMSLSTPRDTGRELLILVKSVDVFQLYNVYC